MPDPKMPSEVTAHVGLFDRVATRVSNFVARAWFFWFCLSIVVVWVPWTIATLNPNWQAVIDTPATVVTFALIAILQNAQRRDSAAMQHKLNAIAESLARIKETDTDELTQAVGVEDKESTDLCLMIGCLDTTSLFRGGSKSSRSKWMTLGTR